jgi:hypothetical protein
VLLAEVDLAGKDDLGIDSQAEAVLARAGRVDGVVVFFEAVLSPGTVLSTRPDSSGRAASHWCTPAWMIADPFQARPGDHVELRYRYRVEGARRGGATTIARRAGE